MSKKRISAKAVRGIATERMGKLYSMSTEAAREGELWRAQRYIEIMTAISRRTKTPIPKEYRYCKGCRMPLSGPDTCRVRLSNHKVIITCGNCNLIKRIPYLKEQKNDRKTG